MKPTAMGNTQQTYGFLEKKKVKIGDCRHVNEYRVSG